MRPTQHTLAARSTRGSRRSMLRGGVTAATMPVLAACGERAGPGSDRSEAPVRHGHALREGVLEIMDEGYGFLRQGDLLPRPDDVYVSQAQVRRFRLRTGDHVTGQSRSPNGKEQYCGLLRVEAVNRVLPETAQRRPA